MKPLSVEYLRPLLAQLLGHENASATIRQESQRLLKAINANNPARITESVVQLEVLAATEGIPLPPVVAVSPMREQSLDDWRFILTTRPNVLIEGPRAATEAVLRALRPHCREPVCCWGDPLGDQHPLTLIVRDVAALTAADQQRLLQWLDRGERSQVLSTAAQPVFSLVERGEFLEDLFYRLNLLRLDAATFVREGA